MQRIYFNFSLGGVKVDCVSSFDWYKKNDFMTFELFKPSIKLEGPVRMKDDGYIGTCFVSLKYNQFGFADIVDHLQCKIFLNRLTDEIRDSLLKRFRIELLKINIKYISEFSKDDLTLTSEDRKNLYQDMICFIKEICEVEEILKDRTKKLKKVKKVKK